MKNLTLLLVFINFLSYGLSIFVVFRAFSSDGFDPKFYIIKFLSPVFWFYTLWVMYTGNYDTYNLVFTSMINCFAFIVFLLASRSTKKNKFDIIFSKAAPDKVHVEGPYRWVRHPFYTSYILCYLSVVFFTQNLIVALMGLLLVITYIIAAKDEEANLLGSNFGDKYKEYKSKTGMFFPKLL